MALFMTDLIHHPISKAFEILDERCKIVAVDNEEKINKL
jgi:hypothetical protein